MKPIISVKEARKLLGRESRKLTDEEVAKLISDLRLLAQEAIKKSRRASDL